jgi:hypothetical protein
MLSHKNLTNLLANNLDDLIKTEKKEVKKPAPNLELLRRIDEVMKNLKL